MQVDSCVGGKQSAVGAQANTARITRSGSSPESSGSSGYRTSRASQVAPIDSKSRRGSVETPLSVMKLAPFGLYFNNKVDSSSYQDQRLALINYAQSIQANATLPVSSRKARDSGSLLFMLAFLGFLAYIVWDGLVVKETDINLIVHGHDSYGNICGRNNRPIKFVEKSGRNYTSRPYTKYTLINAQFERYTLDSNRLKNGELIYVKQNNSTDAYNLRGPRIVAKIAKPDTRIKRSPNDVSMLMRQKLTSRNQTLVNNLKSNLMYQYPPMYGYNNPIATTESSQSAPRMRPNADRRLDSSSNGNPSIRAASGSKLSRNSTQGGGNPFVDASLQFSSSYAITGNPLELTTQGVHHHQGDRSTTLSVIFDDHANDSDRYEHMLITPTSSDLAIDSQARQPSTHRIGTEGFDQNEAIGQLLYLTECVDYCPSDHVELIFYRCMPRNWRFSLFPNAINVTRTFIDDILTDLSQCYRELIYIFSFALILSIGLLILLRFLASIIIWTCIGLLVSLFIAMASYSWMNYYQLIIDLNNIMPHDSTYSDRLSASDKWLVGSIFLTFLAFATIATVIFMRKRILIVTMLFRESGKAIADMPLLLMQPLLTFAALVTITAAWSLGLICLQSMKVPLIDMNTGFVVFKAELLYKIMKWYHIFAFLWVSHFAIACQHYVIGASVSKWYFSPNRYNLNSPIGTSISELILYYLGSVALGSFLVAILKVIRIITRQIQYLVQRNCMTSNGVNGHNSTQMNFAHLSPGSCCVSLSYVWRMFIWFFDNIVMIINRDAYVEIAIHGDSFLAGARRAFNVLASNPLRLLAVKSVGNVLLIVAKVSVVVGTVSVAMVLLDEKTQLLNYSWSPMVISAIYAYVVAHWFLSVYEMVIDALFICYCEDYERTKGQETQQNRITESTFMSQILNASQMY